jgi:hypothetical protein
MTRAAIRQILTQVSMFSIFVEQLLKRPPLKSVTLRVPSYAVEFVFKRNGAAANDVRDGRRNVRTFADFGSRPF